MKPIRTEKTARNIFPILVLFYLKDQKLRKTIESQIDALVAPENVFALEHEVLEFTPVFVDSEKDLSTRAIELLFDGNGRFPIVVSDQLLEKNTAGKTDVSTVGRAVLEGFYSNARLCSLIAIADEALPKISGITSSITHTAMKTAELRRLILQAATRIHLLAEPSKTHLNSLTETPVNIRVAHSKQDLKDCFLLRHQVYSVVGYCDLDVERDVNRLEMDFYDATAIHLIARNEDNGEIVGTHRLIIPKKPQTMLTTVLGSISDIMQSQQEWFRECVAEIREESIRKKLLNPSGAPVPMLRNTNLTENWKSLVKNALDGVEVSRLITAPRYKGLGISKLLFRLGIAASYELRKSLIFGEAIPSHLPMYRKFGFETIETDAGRSEVRGSTTFSAQQIFADLGSGKFAKMSQIARGDLNLIKLANQNLKPEDGISFSVKLGKHKLDGK